jgi:SnoaL-like domain
MARWVAPLLVLLVALCGLPSTAAAQAADPTAAIAAYSAALNAHDLGAALALFDPNGSATDARGRNFRGRDGLTQFLLGSGFASPDAHVTTENVHVIANRAVWTYTCSCTASSTEVRMVVNRDGISVFAIIPPPAARPVAGRQTVLLPWLVGLGVVAAALAWALTLARPKPLPPRPRQGYLLAALLERTEAARGQAASRRMTS